jgi:hypothetical protein
VVPQKKRNKEVDGSINFMSEEVSLDKAGVEDSKDEENLKVEEGKQVELSKFLPIFGMIFRICWLIFHTYIASCDYNEPFEEEMEPQVSKEI